ncbi:MAG: PAS domain S-box protein, partial [Chloroflexi bacterium]|nr:PAS domain S-box protein [Chloroflexota bacterium]
MKLAMPNVGVEARAAERTLSLENFVSGASDGIVIVDSQGLIVVFNPAMETITGWLSEEAVGKDCDEVLRTPSLHPGGGSEGALPFKEVMKNGQSGPYSETVLLHRDGRKIDVGASCSLAPSPGDEPPFAAAVVRDISAIKGAGGVKSDFVSLVSHELRTPLALIKGYIATLLKPEVKLDASTERRFREGINEAADRLTLIVNNFLSASRIESGLFRPHLKEIDIRPVV